ncbi:MAG: hypothetical protein ACRECO_00875 [Xanthobacteraceae bacterium]
MLIPLLGWSGVSFGLLALVALHIGLAIQDYMMRTDDPERDPPAA